MAEVTNIEVITGELADPSEPSPETGGALYRRRVPAGVEVYEINGPFFFGAAGAFSHTVGQVAVLPKVLVIRLRHVPAIDATGLQALRRLVQRARQHGTRVVLSELQTQPREALIRSGMLAELGTDSLAESIDEALAKGEYIVTGEHSRP
jgi:SulP family sulfate permease